MPMHDCGMCKDIGFVPHALEVDEVDFCECIEGQDRRIQDFQDLRANVLQLEDELEKLRQENERLREKLMVADGVRAYLRGRVRALASELGGP